MCALPLPVNQLNIDVTRQQSRKSVYCLAKCSDFTPREGRCCARAGERILNFDLNMIPGSLFVWDCILCICLCVVVTRVDRRRWWAQFLTEAELCPVSGWGLERLLKGYWGLIGRWVAVAVDELVNLLIRWVRESENETKLPEEERKMHKKERNKETAARLFWFLTELQLPAVCVDDCLCFCAFVRLWTLFRTLLNGSWEDGERHRSEFYTNPSTSRATRTSRCLAEQQRQYGLVFLLKIKYFLHQENTNML